MFSVAGTKDKRGVTVQQVVPSRRGPRLRRRHVTVATGGSKRCWSTGMAGRAGTSRVHLPSCSPPGRCPPLLHFPPPPSPCQVTAFKVDPGRLAGLNRRLRGMRLGNFEFAADQLHLGDLRGNR